MRKAFLMGIAGLVLSVQTARAANTTTMTEQQWLSQLKHVEQTCGANKQAYAEMLFSVGKFYHSQNNEARSQEMFARAMKIFEADPGNHGDLIRYYSDQLARIYAEECKNEQAEALFKRAIKLADQLPGKDKTFVVPQSLAGLASLYVSQKRFDEAETATKQRIEMRHRFMNAGQVDVAYVDLATIYIKSGKLDEAKNVIDLLLTMQNPPAEVKSAIALYGDAKTSAKVTN